MDGVKLEAESISRQFKCGDADLGEEVVEIFGNLHSREENVL